MVLRFEHVQHVRAVSLRGAHHEAAGRIGFAAGGEGGGGAFHLHAVLDQGVQEGDGGGQVALIGRDDIGARVPVLRGLQDAGIELGINLLGAAGARAAGAIDAIFLERGGIGQALHFRWRYRPTVAAALFDAVGAHAPDVEQQPLPVARGVIEHGAVERPLIVQRVLQLPRPRADRQHFIAARHLRGRHQRDGGGGGAADDFGQQADAVVEIGNAALHAVVPGGIARGAAHAGTGLAFGDQPGVHGGADLVQRGHHDGIIVEIERITERRHEHHHAFRPGLVLIVDDLRIPGAEQHAVDVFRLRHLHHVAVTIVVVADIFVIKPWDGCKFPFLRVLVPHIPVADQFHAIGIVVAQQDDAVVQHAQGFGVVLGEHAVQHLDLALRGDGFGGMQAGIDPHDGLALRRQRPRLRFVHPARPRQPFGDAAIIVQLGQIGRGGNDRHPHGAPLGGLADIDQLHAIGFSRQFLQIGFVFGIVGEVIIRARRLFEKVPRCSGASRLREAGGRQAQKCRRDKKPMRFHDLHSPPMPGGCCAKTVAQRPALGNRPSRCTHGEESAWANSAVSNCRQSAD